jgi:glycosyltransferase involved in cell wall biosynthesis
MISVVMVACNVERFLSEAIESILRQTYRDFEFVIVDFGSSDKSKEIISSYAARDSRIKFHEIPHCGLAEARNQACLLAQGQYIAIMDADDISVPERLAWEVEFLDSHRQVGVVGGAVDWVDATDKSLKSSWSALHPPVGNREILSALQKENQFWQPSVLMRREAFTIVGGYREAFAPAEDYDLWLRISEKFEMANLDRVVLKYRIHSGQVSMRKHRQQNLSSLAALRSAASRRNGSPDPMQSVTEITPELLIELGIDEEKQRGALAAGFRGWMQIMMAAKEWPAALNAGNEMLRLSDQKKLGARAIADMRLEVARLYWKNNRYSMSIISAAHAVLTRPRLAGRPFVRLLHRFGLA